MQRDSKILEGEACASCGVRRVLSAAGLFVIAFVLAAFVRVNQVGYAASGPTRYLMTSGSEAGATFILKNGGGTTVFWPGCHRRKSRLPGVASRTWPYLINPNGDSGAKISPKTCF